jgi:hypothetical protein
MRHHTRSGVGGADDRLAPRVDCPVRREQRTPSRRWPQRRRGHDAALHVSAHSLSR